MCMSIDWKLTGEYRAEHAYDSTQVEFWKFVKLIKRDDGVQMVGPVYPQQSFKAGDNYPEGSIAPINVNTVNGGAFHAYLTKKDAMTVRHQFDKENYLLRISAPMDCVVALGKSCVYIEKKNESIEVTRVCLTMMHIRHVDFDAAIATAGVENLTPSQRTTRARAPLAPRPKTVKVAAKKKSKKSKKK